MGSGQKSDGSPPQVFKAGLNVLFFNIISDTHNAKAAKLGASPKRSQGLRGECTARRVYTQVQGTKHRIKEPQACSEILPASATTYLKASAACVQYISATACCIQVRRCAGIQVCRRTGTYLRTVDLLLIPALNAQRYRVAKETTTLLDYPGSELHWHCLCSGLEIMHCRQQLMTYLLQDCPAAHGCKG